MRALIAPRHLMSAAGACIELGSYTEAERALADAQASAEHMGLTGVSANIWHHQGMLLARLGDPKSALERADRAIAAFVTGSPAAFVATDRLPELPNGKVDRRALAARGVPNGGRPSGAMAANPIEAQLMRIWDDLIDVKEPEKSLLLLKPLGEVEHGGGKKMKKEDACYTNYLSWVKEYAAANGKKSAQAPADLPADRTVAVFLVQPLK